MLYLADIPILDRRNITLHVLEVLRRCELVLSEDTHRLRLLFQHYQIVKPLMTINQKNITTTIRDLDGRLEDEQDIAMMGWPSNSKADGLGAKLIRLCRRRNYPWKLLPSPSFVTQGAVHGGSGKFQWIGLLPKEMREREKLIKDMERYPAMSVALESPGRLLSTLELCALSLPDRKLLICREVNGNFKEEKRGSPEELVEHYQKEKISRGRVTLIVEKPITRLRRSQIQIDA